MKLSDSFDMDEHEEMLMVPIHKVRRGTFCLRSIDESVVDELMSSVKHCGLLQPIMISPRDDGFEVVFGNHRLEACRRLGWKEIPAAVRRTTDEELVLLQIVENIQRNVKVNPVQEAKGYKMLIDKGMTVQEIASKIGKSYQYVWSKLRLLDRLHPEILAGLAEGRFRRLGTSHAEQLSMIRDSAKQLQLAKAIEDYDISVNELERTIHADIFGKSRSNAEEGRKSPSFWRRNQTYFAGEDRICMLSEDTLNIIFDGLGRKARVVGREAGRSRRKRLLGMAERTIPKTDWLVRFFNEISGLGKISVDGSKIIFDDSMMRNTPFLIGYLEGFLGLELKPIATLSRLHQVFASTGTASSPYGETVV